MTSLILTVEGITVLNCGFPVNFDEDYDAIDTDDFQLTRALILTSIYQAAIKNPRVQGFFPLEGGLK